MKNVSSITSIRLDPIHSASFFAMRLDSLAVFLSRHRLFATGLSVCARYFFDRGTDVFFKRQHQLHRGYALLQFFYFLLHDSCCHTVRSITSPSSSQSAESSRERLRSTGPLRNLRGWDSGRRSRRAGCQSRYRQRPRRGFV